MQSTINQAFSEVYDITMHLGQDLKNKILPRFMEVIEKNRDTRLQSKYRLLKKTRRSRIITRYKNNIRSDV